MMTRPIATKEIKHKDKVYKLELWSPINDKIPSNHFEPPAFRKDFFNDVDMSGTWPQAAKYQESFDKWFDELPSHRQRKYARAIDESIASLYRWYGIFLCQLTVMNYSTIIYDNLAIGLQD